MSTEDKKDIETIRKGSNFKLLRTRRVGRMHHCTWDIRDHVTTCSVVESHITIVTHPSGAGVPAERVCGTISKSMYHVPSNAPSDGKFKKKYVRHHAKTFGLVTCLGKILPAGHGRCEPRMYILYSSMFTCHYAYR